MRILKTLLILFNIFIYTNLNVTNQGRHYFIFIYLYILIQHGTKRDGDYEKIWSNDLQYFVLLRLSFIVLAG